MKHYYCIVFCQGHFFLLSGRHLEMSCLGWSPAPQRMDILMQSGQTHGNCNIDHDLGHVSRKLLRVSYLWDSCQTGTLSDHQNNGHCNIYYILCYGQRTYCVGTVQAGKNGSYGREGLNDCNGSIDAS